MAREGNEPRDAPRSDADGHQQADRAADGGPKAHAEVKRMVTEKVSAFGNAAVTLAMGGTRSRGRRGHGRKVQANDRRQRKG